MNILVDSSVWIDYFKGGSKSTHLDLLIEHNLVCTSGLVLAELIPFLELKNQKKLISLLKELPRIEKNINWDNITKYQTLLLKKGVNKIGIPDLIIIDTIKSNNIAIYSIDKHFELINKHIKFKVFLH